MTDKKKNNFTASIYFILKHKGIAILYQPIFLTFIKHNIYIEPYIYSKISYTDLVQKRNSTKKKPDSLSRIRLIIIEVSY